MTQDETTELTIKFDDKGLIAAIAQDYQTNEILMLAWMNKQAFDKTIETKQAHYWSRSRQELWHKGATSGHIQRVHEILIDCDQDAVILKVEQQGSGACHTGRKSCFYREVTSKTDLKFTSSDKQ